MVRPACVCLCPHTRELPGATAINSQIQRASSSPRMLMPLAVYWKAAVTFCVLAKNQCRYFRVHLEFRNSVGLFSLFPNKVWQFWVHLKLSCLSLRGRAVYGRSLQDLVCKDNFCVFQSLTWSRLFTHLRESSVIITTFNLSFVSGDSSELKLYTFKALFTLTDQKGSYEWPNFRSDEEVRHAVHEWLRGLPKEFFF